MEETNELQDSLTPEGETENQTPSPVEQKPSVNVSELESKNKKLFERATKAEELNKKLKEELAGLKQQASAAPDDLRKEITINRYMTQGYSEEEASALVETKGNPFVKLGIEAQRAKSKVEQAQLPASQVSQTTQEQKSYTKLSSGEKQKVFTEALDRMATRRTGKVI